MLSHTSNLNGVVLIKTESAEHADATTAQLPPRTPIVASIESAAGLATVHAIARAEATVRPALGTCEFRKNVGNIMHSESLSDAQPRFIVASRIARIDPSADGPALTDNATDLRADIAAGVAAGMTSKLCLHPDQIACINAVLSHP